MASFEKEKSVKVKQFTRVVVLAASLFSPSASGQENETSSNSHANETTTISADQDNARISENIERITSLSNEDIADQLGVDTSRWRRIIAEVEYAIDHSESDLNYRVEGRTLSREEADSYLESLNEIRQRAENLNKIANSIIRQINENAERGGINSQLENYYRSIGRLDDLEERVSEDKSEIVSAIEQEET